VKDSFAAQSVADCDDPAIHAILEEVCGLTGMGFAAVARVTEDRWIACQLLDRIEFGLDPGDELEVKKTICDDIRKSGEAIIIDEVGADPQWNRHPVPILYGFQSYVSIPIMLDDGSFFGTLCAIDPKPRALSAAETVAALHDCARRVVAIVSAKQSQAAGQLAAD
jgi:GAF domain-containing protein